MMGVGNEITLENRGRVCTMNRLRVVGTREGGTHQENGMDGQRGRGETGKAKWGNQEERGSRRWWVTSKCCTKFKKKQDQKSNSAWQFVGAGGIYQIKMSEEWLGAGKVEERVEWRGDRTVYDGVRMCKDEEFVFVFKAEKPKYLCWVRKEHSGRLQRENTSKHLCSSGQNSTSETARYIEFLSHRQRTVR